MLRTLGGIPKPWESFAASLVPTEDHFDDIMMELGSIGDDQYPTLFGELECDEYEAAIRMPMLFIPYGLENLIQEGYYNVVRSLMRVGYIPLLKEGETAYLYDAMSHSYVSSGWVKESPSGGYFGEHHVVKGAVPVQIRNIFAPDSDDDGTTIVYRLVSTVQQRDGRLVVLDMGTKDDRWVPSNHHQNRYQSLPLRYIEYHYKQMNTSTARSMYILSSDDDDDDNDDDDDDNDGSSSGSSSGSGSGSNSNSRAVVVV